MAADQLNKRSKVSNVIHHTSSETHKAKKKKYYHYDLNTKPSISLEWDEKKEQVLPKKQQISIARRELTPFLPLVGNYQNVLGDVFAVPPELFELNNLTGLLSFEVWQTYLSAEEREFLTQFLPEGVDPHTVVYELLAGNNFCFGNPFQKWSASVCSDYCHPDSVLRQEQCNKANKRAYYSELEDYHNKMIGTLQIWKEKWEIGVNPENVRLQTTPRSENDIGKSGPGPSHENGTRYGLENDVVATSDSFSSDANDKSYTSDSPQLVVTNGETLKRVSKLDSGNKYYDSSVGRSATRSKKEDKVRKLNIECGDDGAKYMSYIKVSKEQHERVKSSMKHSNTSIQPKSLNHVLGNLDSFCVQPYVVFEEEERQKLHDYWLHLAKKDVPAGFENWKSYRSAKLQLTKSLRKEMEDKWKLNGLPAMDLCNQDKEFVIGVESEAQSLSESQSQSISNPCHEQQVDRETNGVLLISPEENVEQNDDTVFRSEADLNASNHEITDESSQDSDQNHNLPHINVCPMAIDTNNDVLIESNAFPSTLVEYPENINRSAASIGEQFPPLSTASEIWPPVSLPPSVYYNQTTSVTHGYPSSFFNPYGNQDHDELLLHSLYKDPGSSHYLHEQKLSRLGFLPAGNDSIPGTSQFPRNISSSFPLGSRHEIQENLFTIPRQEHLLPLNHVQDWPVNLPIPASSHHRLSQNWFSDDVVARDGWSGGLVPNQELGNSGQVADESLFSVLSQCNALRSGVHFGSTDQFVQPGNYLGVTRGPLTSTDIVPTRDARGPGLNHTSSNETQFGWMNMNLTGGKSFPRLWSEKDLG